MPQRHCCLILYSMCSNPLKSYKKSWLNVVFHYTWIATAGGRYLSMAEAKPSHDTSVCCSTVGLLFACQSAFMLFSTWLLSLEMRISIYGCWSSVACRTTDVLPALMDTRAVSLKPLCICLVWWNPVGPSLLNHAEGLLCSRVSLFVIWWCFYKKNFLRALKCASTHKRTYGTQSNRYCADKIQPCVHTLRNTHTLDDVICIIWWNLGQRWRGGSRRDEQSLS